MKFLAIEKELRSEGFPPALLEAEARAAWELHQRGEIRELYFKQASKEAVLILECVSLERAQAVVASLPLVKAGLIEFTVEALVPYDGFERLFQRDPKDVST